MLDQQLESIDENTLAQLVLNGAAERRDLEFKRDLPGNGDDQKKEFLADVTSLANAQGGDLVFGIEDADGMAAALPGVQAGNVDAEVLRLENIIRSGVEPRLIGVRMHWVKLSNGGGALIIRVPAGLLAPHRVIYRNSGRFYNRTSRGKYEMDVHELRHAFTQSEQLAGRFRELHANALSASQGVDMPFRINFEPTAVVSVMPLALFREARDLPVTRDHAVIPIEPHDLSSVNMIEGVILHTSPNQDTWGVRSYAVTFREGRVDVAWTIGGIRQNEQGEELRLVSAPRFENGLRSATAASQMQLGFFGIEGPWIVLASVLNVRGCQMILGDGYPTRTAFRDQVLIGELRVDRLDGDSILPLLKNFWLLFGEHRPEAPPIGRQ